MVLFGDYFGQSLPLAWVPTTVGLLIFGFSSGFFTVIKYQSPFSKKAFWQQKARRLGINFLTINLILLILFIYKGSPGLVSWHTLVNLLGLNRFLNWFHIKNINPYGSGMWFFTLLLVFYLLYLLMEKRSKKQMILLTILFIGIAYVLNFQVIYGHALWLTF